MFLLKLRQVSMMFIHRLIFNIHGPHNRTFSNGFKGSERERKGGRPFPLMTGCI